MSAVTYAGSFLSFGAGCAVLLFLILMLQHALPGGRPRGVRLAGSFILALGLVTLGRGIVPTTAGHGLHHIWHFACGQLPTLCAATASCRSVDGGLPAR
jgi:hypothetical protein